MPAVAMGTWSGSYKDCEKQDFLCINQHARFAVENWLHIGGTHIDGANNYRTQTSVAEALQRSGVSRDSVFITTKCPGAIGYQATIQCAEDNLQMLGLYGADGVGYIDLLLVHFPFYQKPACRFHATAAECQPPHSSLIYASKEELQETWRAMEELKRIGVVKSIGVSDYNLTHLGHTLETATEPIEVHQVQWNPRSHDEAMLDFCKSHGIQLQAWSPLGGAQDSVLSEPAVKTIAAAHKVSTPQVVLRWALQRGVAVVVGTANPEHAKSDLDIFGFNLTADEVNSINGLQAPMSVQI